MDFKIKHSWIVIILLPLVTLGQSKSTQPHQDIEQLFLHPITSAKPYVWWHWMGSNFSKYGITKDLEAMKDAGMGGATIFNLTSGVQESHSSIGNEKWKNQTYRSPAYWDALKFAAKEAKRLGLELGLHNSVGYSTTGGPWVKENQGMFKLVWSEVEVSGGTKLSVQIPKPTLPKESGWGSSNRQATYYRDIAVLAIPALDSFGIKDVIDITAKMDTTRNITWDAPSGKWKIFSIGYAPTMVSPHPIPEELLGKSFEVDKMSQDLNAYHWNVVIDSLKAHLGVYFGSSFKHLLIDSYEAGFQNWTKNFRTEFIKRKGYDPIPWLVSFGKPITNEKNSKSAKIINSHYDTKRFEWDYTDVVNRLFYDNGWAIAKKLCNQNNLSLQWEPYSGPFDIIEGAALADMPMGEFWTGGKGGINTLIPAAARANGKNIVGAESFTGSPSISKFNEDPAMLKPSADGTFASGVNRLVLHHWVMQPFDDKYQPGMGMGWWGTHFSRHQTWLEPAKAFFSYLARTQTLLQYGEQVADYLCVDKLEGNADVIATNDFLKANILVKNHQIILPSGRQYAFINFPKGDTILPAVALKIKRLVIEGAYVVCPKPNASPSLQGFPVADLTIKQIGNEVWGNDVQHIFVKGWVTTKLNLAIKKTTLQPDFIVEKADSSKYIRYVHRKKGNEHIYFIANTNKAVEHLIVSCRVSGLQPFLFQAEDASITPAPIWNEEGGRTKVQLSLNGNQSVFIVFRKKNLDQVHPTNLQVAGNEKDEKTIFQNNKPYLISSKDLSATVSYSNGSKKEISIQSTPTKQIDGPWELSFFPKLDSSFKLTLPTLKDLSTIDDPNVKYFAGTVHYFKHITITHADLKADNLFFLNLGSVHNIVSIKINQQNLGVVWYPPYQKDITNALKEGDNLLDIAVTTNWANRLIGDEQEPSDVEYGTDRGDRGRPLKEFPNWFNQDIPRPSKGRKTFTTWYYYRKDSPLQSAGLIGPVKLVQATRKEL